MEVQVLNWKGTGQVPELKRPVIALSANGAVYHTKGLKNNAERDRFVNFITSWAYFDEKAEIK